jgi:hypothetical protein
MSSNIARTVPHVDKGFHGKATSPNQPIRAARMAIAMGNSSQTVHHLYEKPRVING